MMANPKAVITQKDASRLFKAAMNAGYSNAKIVLHPDGRLEASASLSSASVVAVSENSWDETLNGP